MYKLLGFNQKQITTACILSAVVASGVAALTSPSAANNKSALAISVNRAGKSDRLELAPKGGQLRPDPSLEDGGGTPRERFTPQRDRCRPHDRFTVFYRRA